METISSEQTKPLKQPPAVMPKGVREYYEVISYPEMYAGEEQDNYQSRLNLTEAFNKELVRQGLTLDDLVAAELGIVKPTAASPLLNSLIARI